VYNATVLLKVEGKFLSFTTQHWQFYLMPSSAKHFGLLGRHQLLVPSANIK
jgi:hypothetical protein